MSEKRKVAVNPPAWSLIHNALMDYNMKQNAANTAQAHLGKILKAFDINPDEVTGYDLDQCEIILMPKKDEGDKQVP